MRQVFRKIPVYTGDVSGVCSALFELGGMVVMHDPSGCNSTYNTHDEIRWYDQDSLIFLSGLDEMDAIMGSDDRLIHDIMEAARIYTPKFIAVANSPIPYITGMDFDAVCRAVEQETGIPSFYISTNGMHDYIHGAGLAFLRLADRFTAQTDRGAKLCHTNASQTYPGHVAPSGDTVKNNSGKNNSVKNTPGKNTPGKSESEKRNPIQPPLLTCNLLGLTPLDFANPAALQSLTVKLTEAGIAVQSSWAMEKKDRAAQYAEPQPAEAEGQDPGPSRPGLLDRITRSSLADVNLVLSSAGFYAAGYMYEHYGIPFVAGIPAAGVEDQFIDAVRLAVQTGHSQFPFRERGKRGENRDNKDNRDDIDSRETISHIEIRKIRNSRETTVHKEIIDNRDNKDNKDSGKIRNNKYSNDKSEYFRPLRSCFTDSADTETGDKTSGIPVAEEERAKYCFIGEPVIMTSLAAQTEARTGCRTHVFGATEGAAVFLGEGDFPLRGEEELQETLQSLMKSGTALKVVADPCYADILPEGCGLMRLPHLAFSGRLFLDEIPDMITVTVDNLREAPC